MDRDCVGPLCVACVTLSWGQVKGGIMQYIHPVITYTLYLRTPCTYRHHVHTYTMYILLHTPCLYIRTMHTHTLYIHAPCPYTHPVHTCTMSIHTPCTYCYIHPVHTHALYTHPVGPMLDLAIMAVDSTAMEHTYRIRAGVCRSCVETKLRAGVCRPCDTIELTATSCNFSLCLR